MIVFVCSSETYIHGKSGFSRANIYGYFDTIHGS